MQLATLLVETLKSGKITVSQNDVEAVEVTVANKKIDVNAKDKQFIKDIISSALGATTKKGTKKSIQINFGTFREARSSLPLVKELVEDLCREGVTITVSYKGDRVITVGSEADSKFTRVLTGTKGIEINRPLKLAEMGI